MSGQRSEPEYEFGMFTLF